MADDDAVKVVILTGAAPEGRLGGFCSGGDTKESGATRGVPGTDPRSRLGVPHDALTGDLARHDDHAAMRLHLMPKPTIAMVGGPAVGAGCSLAAACDFRFASDDAVFASSFSSNGLSGDYGGTFFWTQIIGTARTRELYFLNDKIPAERALAIGMVHAVVPAGELRDYTMRRRPPSAPHARLVARAGEGQPQRGRVRGRPPPLPVRPRSREPATVPRRHPLPPRHPQPHPVNPAFSDPTPKGRVSAGCRL